MHDSSRTSRQKGLCPPAARAHRKALNSEAPEQVNASRVHLGRVGGHPSVIAYSHSSLGPNVPLLWAGVGEIANDLPSSVLLALEDVHARLERADRNARALLRFVQCPNQPDNGNITVDQDLAQIERVVRAMRFVAQRAMQRSAYVVVTSIRNLGKLITKVFREDATCLICLASVERLSPRLKFRSNNRSSVFPANRHCGNGPREQHDCGSRQPQMRVHHGSTLHFACPLPPLTVTRSGLCSGEKGFIDRFFVGKLKDWRGDPVSRPPVSVGKITSGEARGSNLESARS